jgi:hypothetical protein
MATYLNLKTNLLNELLPNATDTSVLDAAVSSAIARSIKFYSSTPFWFNEASTAFVTVASQSEYTAPSDMAVLTDLVMANGNYRSRLERKNRDFILRNDISDYTGIPSYFFLYGSRFRLYPVPRESLTVSISYISQLSPSPDEYTASASNAWTNEAEPLIRMHAKIDVYMNFMKDYQAAQVLIGMERDILDMMKERSMQSKYSGNVEGWL